MLLFTATIVDHNFEVMLAQSILNYQDKLHQHQHTFNLNSRFHPSSINLLGDKAAQFGMKTFTLSCAIDNIKECNKSTQKRPLSFHQISSTHFGVAFQEKERLLDRY